MDILFALVLFLLIALIVTHQLTSNGHIEYTYYSAYIFMHDRIAMRMQRNHTYTKKGEPYNNIRYHKKNGVYFIRLYEIWHEIDAAMIDELRIALKEVRPSIWIRPKNERIVVVDFARFKRVCFPDNHFFL